MSQFRDELIQTKRGESSELDNGHTKSYKLH